MLERAKPYLSDEHFTVDGMLIEAWASQKSFRRKDGGERENRLFEQNATEREKKQDWLAETIGFERLSFRRNFRPPSASGLLSE